MRKIQLWAAAFTPAVGLPGVVTMINLRIAEAAA